MVFIGEKHLIPSSLISINNGSVVTLELNSGRTENTFIEEYNTQIENTDVVSDGNSIYFFKNGKWNKLPINGYEIEKKPVLIGSAIFFVSAEPEDLSPSSKLFVWKYENGEIIKYSKNSVWPWSDILAFDDNLIFVNSSDLSIRCKNVLSGDERILAFGSSICWKEIGKSFYFQALGEGLALYNMESSETVIINEKVDLASSPIYNEKRNVLMITCDDPNNIYSYSNYVAIFYYLDSNKFIYCSDYFKYMNIDSDITHIGYAEPTVDHIYWN